MSNSSLRLVPAKITGMLLAKATWALGCVRRDPRPLHPRGEWWSATLTRGGSDLPTSTRWVDGAGEHDVLVRFSTSVGLPGWCPDIQGMALRVPTDEHGGGHTDVLVASTGTGPIGRYVLRPARAGRGAPYTMLLPYRSPRGAVVLGLFLRDERTYVMAHSGVTSAWHPFATLVLREQVPAPAGERTVRFDPILSPPPGLRHYDWVVGVREPAYRAARA